MTKIIRCPWSAKYDDVAKEYHDHEWCKLNLDEHYLFEMVVLEFFQAGISWSVILHKREAFRQAFKDFDVRKVAQMDESDIERLMHDRNIVRNKNKIKAAINNARVFLKIEQEEGSFANFLRKYIPQPIIHHPQTADQIPTHNDISDKLATVMKQAGFSYVGSISLYSFLQAVGLINDHIEKCSFKYTNA